MLTALFRSSSRRGASHNLLKREFATPGSKAKEELDDIFLPLVRVLALHVFTFRFESRQAHQYAMHAAGGCCWAT